jgi:hypothetical protein
MYIQFKKGVNFSKNIGERMMSFVYMLVFMMEQGAVIDMGRYKNLQKCLITARAASAENLSTNSLMVKGDYFCILYPKPA